MEFGISRKDGASVLRLCSHESDAGAERFFFLPLCNISFATLLINLFRFSLFCAIFPENLLK